MNKIIHQFEKNELIRRSASDTDSCNMEIRLTDKGLPVFHELDGRASRQIENLLAVFDDAD